MNSPFHTRWMSKVSGNVTGLITLCILELLGRFAFYMLLGVLVLYASDKERGGLGLSQGDATSVYGAYLALVFFTPVFGGVLAEKWLGLRRAILAGIVLFAIGLVLIGTRNIPYFYVGLGLLCAGNGLSRPSVSMLLGNLYPKDDQKRDAAFNVLFFFINAGAFIAFLGASLVRNRFSWQWVFWCAAIALVIAVAVLVANWSRLEAGDFWDPEAPNLRGALRELAAKLLLPAAVAAGLGYVLSVAVNGWPIPPVDTTAVFAMVAVVAFFLRLPGRVSKEERPRVLALLMVFLAASTFFAVLHMHGSALTIWAKEKTNREVPWVPDIWTHPAEPTYFSNSSAPAARHDQSFIDNSRSTSGEAVRIVDPEVYQSWNPFWVMVFTPIVVVIFRKREASGAPVSTAKKMFYGLVLTTAAMLVMEFAAIVYEISQTRVSGLWLVGTYCVITLGEVCLTPMGQSLVMKLAPVRLAGLMMGGWFCAMAIGNELSGLLGKAQSGVPPWLFFLALTIVVGAVAALFRKFLTKLDRTLTTG